MPDSVSHPGVYVEELPSGVRTITGVATSVTAFVGQALSGPVDEPVTITSVGDFERTFGELHQSMPLGYAVRDFFLNGGSQAVIVRLAGANFPGSLSNKTGLYALERTDLFNLLCIAADVRGGDVPDDVYEEALSYCVRRRAMLLVDAKAAWTTVAAAQSGLAGMNLTGDAARNAALYFPRIRQADATLGGQVGTFAASGMVAGVIARTDARHGVWKAPAGLDAVLDGAAGLSVEMTDAENGVLNPLGINCLRSFPVHGRVVWGARTLRGADAAADEYKYVPVRRTALFIEESLYRGLAWVAFEPNDEPLWAQIRLTVGAFMHNLFRQGAFQGQTPREAYLVKCDRETTTQSDIDLGVVNIVVGFAPLKAAEFVIIRLQQLAGRIEA